VADFVPQKRPGKHTSECAGPVEAAGRWSGKTYCAAGLANKTFTPPN